LRREVLKHFALNRRRCASCRRHASGVTLAALAAGRIRGVMPKACCPHDGQLRWPQVET
jgi:hypothetical protein